MPPKKRKAPAETAAARRADRAAARRKRYPTGAPVPPFKGQTFLETVSVGVPSHQDYMRRVQDFLLWTQTHCLPLLGALSLECAILEYFDHLFWEGHASPEGEKVWAALKFADGLGKSGDFLLPRVSRALKGWHRLSPPLTRQPLPWLGLMGIVGVCLQRGLVTHAASFVLQFTLYLRPGELMELKVSQVVPPIHPGGGAVRGVWAFIVRPYEEESSRPGKTGEFDESLLLDDNRLSFLDSFLEVLTQGRSQDSPLWPFDLAQHQRVLEECLQVLCLLGLGIELYSLRHGGASDDFLHRRRSLLELKDRGRWRSDASVRRYKKSARALKELEKFPEATLVFCRLVDARLASFFMSPEQVPAV